VIGNQAVNANLKQMQFMARARQSRDWRGGDIGADSTCKPIPVQRLSPPKKSERHLLAIKNIVPAKGEGISSI
jgi:hypothetical protein